MFRNVKQDAAGGQQNQEFARQEQFLRDDPKARPQIGLRKRWTDPVYRPGVAVLPGSGLRVSGETKRTAGRKQPATLEQAQAAGFLPIGFEPPKPVMTGLRSARTGTANDETPEKLATPVIAAVSEPLRRLRRDWKFSLQTSFLPVAGRSPLSLEPVNACQEIIYEDSPWLCGNAARPLLPKSPKPAARTFVVPMLQRCFPLAGALLQTCAVSGPRLPELAFDWGDDMRCAIPSLPAGVAPDPLLLARSAQCASQGDRSWFRFWPPPRWITLRVAAFAPLLLLGGLYLAKDRMTRTDTILLVGENKAIPTQISADANGSEDTTAADPLVQISNKQAALVNELQHGINNRAAIALNDDFRGGLSDWVGKGEWSRSWSYDQAGFLLTGSLALYKPSLHLTDYSMEFLGQIAKKSIGFVYRAADPQNYYATRISFATSGPLPEVSLERYAVIGGNVSAKVVKPLLLMLRPESFYRFRVNVVEDGFTLLVEGKIVDYWRDDRLASGGIGFFSEKGEFARLRRVELTHQYDFLGRLCAVLAPFNRQSRNGPPEN
ncbi:MAG: hypothetical protein HYZ37_01115 [Candidatus Solibacter usitatus]|nr:hypothetical protein [Candidatus Solibacter usitatus]